MEFYVIINDEQQGPFTIDQLSALDITPETEVWTQGMDDWQQAGDVPALTTLLQQLEYKRYAASQAAAAATPAAPAATAAAVPPVPRQPQPYVPQERTFEPQPQPQPEPQIPQPSHSRGGCFKWCLLFIVIILAVMVLTVPSREAHVDAIKDVTSDWVGSTIEESGMGGSMFSEMAKWIGSTGTDFVIDQMFTYDNYIVCSVGALRYGTREHTVSLGILGHVFTFSKDDINQALKSKFLNQDDDSASQPSIDEEPPVEEVVPDAPGDSEEGIDETPQDGEAVNPAQELLDSMAARAKREAVRAAKEWAKKKIDEM